MRDYLEALLEEQEEPEQEAPALPEEPAAGGNDRRGAAEDPERETTSDDAQPFEIEREPSNGVGTEAIPGERMEGARALEEGLTSLTVSGPERVRRAAGTAAEPEAAESDWTTGAEVPTAAERWSGAALYADLVQQEAAAAWPETAVRQSTPIQLARPEGSAGRALTLAELDRAVQRDARRYDGAFPLY